MSVREAKRIAARLLGVNTFGLARVPVILLFAGAARATSQSPRPASVARESGVTLTAVRRRGPIALDGKLDEPDWAHAPVGRDFVQSYPQQGRPAVDPTEVRVLYDDDAIYVGARMFDAHPDSIAAQLTRRDVEGTYSDWLHIGIDSYHDRRTAFHFAANPIGVQLDSYLSDDGTNDVNWDAVWQVATSVDSAGWVAEFRIPFSQMRFAAGDTDGSRTWGFQVIRDVARRNERDALSPWRLQLPGTVSQFGVLTGIANVPEPRRLELLPYASSSATSAPGSPTNPFHSRMATSQSAGADLRAGLPGGLTLSATVNPDFGQVEVDPAVVNLTAFETFFPEKRPFFLESADVFSFGQVRQYNDYGTETFLYSRRIGREPERSPFTEGVVNAASPVRTTILGAAKVTGKHGPWTVGVLDALTARETARIQLANGTESTTPVEPLTDYFAGRLRREFRDGQTVIGGMVSGSERDMHDGVFDALLSRSARTEGIDFDHAFAGRRWYLTGFAAASDVRGTSGVLAQLQRAPQRYFQRPDATYLGVDTTRSSLSGHMEELALQKTGTWAGSIALKEASPGFEINDAGFQKRVDYRAMSSIVGYQSFKAWRALRNRSFVLYTNQVWNYGGTMIFNSTDASAQVAFANFWSANIVVGGQPRYLDDRMTRGGPLAATPAGWSVLGGVSSDTRLPVVITAQGSLQRDELHGQAVSAGLSASARPASNVDVMIGPTLSRQFAPAQYVRTVSDANAVATYGARYVFAALHQTTLSLDTRVDWTLTPKLSVQTYVQPFITAPHYAEFKEFTTPRDLRYAVYGVDRGTVSRNDTTGVVTIDPDASGPSPSFSFTDPTFNLRSLRGNAVLRWEYRPGSALFFVWQQLRNGVSNAGDFHASRDVGGIFRERPTNVFLVKATYWISP